MENIYYHVLIETKGTGKKGGESEKYLELDKLNKQEIIDDIIIPYIKHDDFQFDGYFVNSDQLKRLVVKTSEKTTEELYQYEKSRTQSHHFFLITRRSMFNYDEHMTDVTKDLMSEAKVKPSLLIKDKKTEDNYPLEKIYKKVFIVHGRDELAKNETARFIEKLGLEAIILHEQENQGMTIIEKIEHYTDVDYGIVLYTPCDEGSLRDQNDFKPRARQNVIFEHGFLIGKLKRENVCALVKDEIEVPNDISGIVYISMDREKSWMYKVARELKNVGYNIDMNNLF